MGAMPVLGLPFCVRANTQDFDSWLKDLRQEARGKGISRESLREFVAGLDLPAEVKRSLIAMTPADYTGLASELANAIARD